MNLGMSRTLTALSQQVSKQNYYYSTKCKTSDFFSTVELEQSLSQQGKSLVDFDSKELERPFEFDQASPALLGHIGSGSGGYADFIFHYAAKHLFQLEKVTLKYKNLKNPDFREATLEKDGEVLMRFGIANGFRNIQNIVQKLKHGKCTYDYVEIMACPAGKEFFSWLKFLSIKNILNILSSS